jgi:uncharacterized protein YegP (UPF0339 family)
MRNKALLFVLGVISIVLIVLTTLIPLIDPTLQTLVLIAGIVLNVGVIILFVYVRDKSGLKAEVTPSKVSVSESRYKFEVYRDKSDEFRFRLVAPNGEPIASGEGYTAKASCLHGIESIKENAPGARIEDLTKND